MKTAIFYSPIKVPDEHKASGLPRVAALIVRALAGAGYQVNVPDLPLSYDPIGDPAIQATLRNNAEAAGKKLLATMPATLSRPDVFVTYHCYYKSPDWIGPTVAKHLNIPYIIIEGSHSERRASGPWMTNHAGCSAALQSATILLSSTARDRPGLERIAGPKTSVLDFPPFIDVAPFLRAGQNGSQNGARTRIIAAATMRDARKRESFARLFDALRTLDPATYSLDVAGEGVERANIETLAQTLSADGHAISFKGHINPDQMPAFLAQGQILAWPGVGEAYGLIYLEAQAAGLPVVAQGHYGVPSVVQNQVTGILTDPADGNAYASALRRLIASPDQRTKIGRAGQNWVVKERSLDAASARLRRALQPWMSP